MQVPTPPPPPPARKKSKASPGSSPQKRTAQSPLQTPSQGPPSSQPKREPTKKPSHAQLIASGGLQEFDDHLLLQPHHLSSIELRRIVWGCNSVPSYGGSTKLLLGLEHLLSRRLKGLELCTASGRTLKKPFWTHCEGGSPGTH